MNIYTIVSRLIIFCTFLVLPACQETNQSSNSTELAAPNSGSLKLRLDLPQRSSDDRTAISNPSRRDKSATPPRSVLKTLVPETILEANSYNIEGTGPDGATFSVSASSTGSVLIEFLSFGTWDISVDAVNAEGTVFANGEQTVQINVAETTQTTISLGLLDGNGSFALAIEWPTSTVQNPQIVGQLTGAEQSIDLEFDLGEEKTNFSTFEVALTDTVPAGYYTLTVAVYDGVSDDANRLAFGIAESVQILASDLTVGNFSLSGVTAHGGLAFGFEFDLDENIAVSIENSVNLPSEFSFDSDTVFTANAFVDEDLPANSISFLWYLNSELIEFGTSVTIDAAASRISQSINGRFSPGNYRLDVIAVNADASRAGSDTFEFSVTGNPIEVSTLPPQGVGNVSGRIVSVQANGDDSSLQAISGAQVLIGGIETITDTDGSYVIENIAAGEQVLQVSVDGFFTTYQPLTVVPEQLTNNDTTVLLEEEVFVMNSEQGGVFSPGSGAGQIGFSANSLVDADGNLYSGSVDVSAVALDPSSPSFFESFPGDFTGVSTEGDVVDIISFGVLAVELRDDQGNPLAIADGQTAELRIAVADPSSAPPTLPLWFLDEDTGLWTEEGSATLVGNEYVGTVNHFSWWNFDYRPAGFNDGFFARTNISGQVVTEQGIAVDGATVRLNSIAGLAWADTVTTDINGNFATSTFVARNVQAPSYTAYASKNGLASAPTPIDLVQNQDALGVELVLLSPAIRFDITGRIGSETRTLIDNGPAMRFGNISSSPAQFTITNSSVDGLEIVSVALQDGGAGPFSILTGGDMGDIGNPNRRGNILEGGSISFFVSYIVPPGGAVQATNNLIITSNDVDRPTLTIPLEAGTDRNIGIVQSVTLPAMQDHIGFILRDQGGFVTPVNTNLEQFALVIENGTDASRVFAGFDLSSIRSISEIFSVTLTSTSEGHNGLQVLQGGQGPVLVEADIEPVSEALLSDNLLAPGTQGTLLNGIARQIIQNEVASATAPVAPVFRIMLRNSDLSVGLVDLTQFQLSIEYRE